MNLKGSGYLLSRFQGLGAILWPSGDHVASRYVSSDPSHSEPSTQANADIFPLRTSADRCRLRAPAVWVGEELADDEDGGGEAEGGVSVSCSAVGVAEELAVVRPPRVGGLDDPSHAEP